MLGKPRTKTEGKKKVDQRKQRIIFAMGITALKHGHVWMEDATIRYDHR